MLNNMIHTVAVENKLDGDAPPYIFLFSSYTKALEFAHDIDKTIEMADASDRYKVFVDSAYPDKTNGLDWLYDGLGDRINAKAYKSARTDKDKANLYTMKQDKFIPKEKLSKKKRRELDNQKRNSWGEIKPVTRRVESVKDYNRQHEKAKTRDLDT